MTLVIFRVALVAIAVQKPFQNNADLLVGREPPTCLTPDLFDHGLRALTLFAAYPPLPSPGPIYPTNVLAKGPCVSDFG
jgi:hypothetical protein